MKLVFLANCTKIIFIFKGTFYGNKSKRIKGSKEKLRFNRKDCNNIAFLNKKSIAQKNWVRTQRWILQSKNRRN